jgi:hypothetical protein
LTVEVPVAKRQGILAYQAGNAYTDILLAATAIEHRLAVATRNERKFASTRAATVNPWSWDSQEHDPFSYCALDYTSRTIRNTAS